MSSSNCSDSHSPADYYYLYRFLSNRQTASASTHRRRDYQDAVRQWAQAPVASVLSESPILIDNYDKIFASTWISEDRVVAGTKDNKLLVIDTMDHVVAEIPTTTQGTASSASGPTPKHLQLERELLTPSGVRSQRFAKCQGIRSVATNPSHTLLAVALADPPCVMMYRLPDLTFLSTTAHGHRDAVFSVQWINDTTFLTGSRDGTLGLWGIGTAVQWKTDGRVRDTRLLDTTAHEAASLSSSGTVDIWNINTQQKARQMPLCRTRELVCMAQQQQLVAVGSQAHVTLLDTRVARQVHEIPSQDEDWGVRSLEMREPIITCGGGRGLLSFYDMRCHAFVPSASDNGNALPYRSVSSGWVDKSSPVYRNYFSGQHRLAPQAIYTLIYSPDNSTKLFTAGGPIQTSLKGCHAAVWSCTN